MTSHARGPYKSSGYPCFSCLDLNKISLAVIRAILLQNLLMPEREFPNKPSDHWRGLLVS